LANKKGKIEDSAHRFWNKINLVARVALLMRKEPPGKAAFRKLLELIQEVIPFDSATLYLYDKRKKRLDEVVSLGDKVEPIDFVRFDFGTGMSAWAAQQKKPILLSHIKNKDRPPELARSSFLFIPLMVEEKLIGVIDFAHSQTDFFMEKDLQLLSIVGDQIAVSIERMIYQKQLERKEQELRKIQNELKGVPANDPVENKLERAGRLAVSINHEINNPLSVIIGNIQCLLYLDKDLEPGTVERLRRIESESLKIAEINRRLLQIEELAAESSDSKDKNSNIINYQKSPAGV